MGVETESIINCNQQLMLAFISFSHLCPCCPILSPTTAIHAQAPLPSPEGCGPVLVALDGGELGGWEEQGQESGRYEVRHENGPRLSSWPVFAVLFSQLQCLTPPTPALRQPHDNADVHTPRQREHHRRKSDTTRPRGEANAALGLPTTTWAAQCRSTQPHDNERRRTLR